MQIPDLFNQAITDTFYDKQMEIWLFGTITDDEGSVVGSGKQDLVETIMGNFQFKTLEKIQQEYGKEIIAEAIVTCSITKAIVDNILVYNEQEYEIKGIIPSDSHITLLLHKEGV